MELYKLKDNRTRSSRKLQELYVFTNFVGTYLISVINERGTATLCIYVDNMLLVRDDAIKDIEQKLDIRNGGPLKDYLGLSSLMSVEESCINHIQSRS